MKLTVAISTWNRAALLDQTLRQMHQLRIPQGVKWELLVVNNNCSDETDKVLAKHAEFLPVRRLFEPVQGKSYACNRLVAEAAGELIVWTDDDVLVDPNWLAEYVAASRLWPQASYFGGLIEPLFETTPPAWIARNLQSVRGPLALLDLGPDCRILKSDEFPFGANMATRAEALRGQPFDVRLGPTAGRLLRGEDTGIVQRFKDDGRLGVWIPSAKVRHFVPARRLTRQYLRQWFKDGGVSSFRSEGLPPNCKFVAGVPRYVLYGLWKGRALSCALRPFKGHTWIMAFRRAAFCEGFLAEYRAGQTGLGEVGPVSQSA